MYHYYYTVISLLNKLDQLAIPFEGIQHSTMVDRSPGMRPIAMK